MCPLSWSNWNWRCWFLRREENWTTQRKTLVARREPTTNSTHIWHQAGIEPGPHLWEGGALTTAPSLPPVSGLVAPWKFDVVKTVVFALKAALLWQILRTWGFRGATISWWFPYRNTLLFKGALSRYLATLWKAKRCLHINWIPKLMS